MRTLSECRSNREGILLILLFCMAMTMLKAAPPANIPSPEAMNQALGIPLFTVESLWSEPAVQVAERLRLRQESLTSAESGYRLYPRSDASILGVRPFSIFLQGIGGKAARF